MLTPVAGARGAIVQAVKFNKLNPSEQLKALESEMTRCKAEYDGLKKDKAAAGAPGGKEKLDKLWDKYASLKSTITTLRKSVKAATAPASNPEAAAAK